MELKEIIPNLNKPVMYGGSKYILTGSVVRKTEKGVLYYQAELLDKCGRSVCYTRLEDIERCEEYEDL